MESGKQVVLVSVLVSLGKLNSYVEALMGF